MDNNVVFSTISHNYMYSFNRKEYILIHPILKILAERNHTSPETLFNDPDCAGYSREEITHHWNKYQYLQQQNFIEPKEQPTFGRITEATIERQLRTMTVLTFEVTDKCNLRCRYCGYGDVYSGYDQRAGQDLSFENAKGIMDYLFGIWTEFAHTTPPRNVVIGFYGGEPLVNFPLVRQIIDYVSQQSIPGVSFSYTMTTNAMLLQKKQMEYIVDHNIQLLLSLDGTEVDNMLRIDTAGKSSFNRVFNNIKELQRLYPEFFRKQVAFNSVIHSGSDLERILEFFKKEFDKKPQLSPLNNSSIKDSTQYRQMYRDVNKSIDTSGKSKIIDRRLGYLSPRISGLNYFLLHLTNESFKDYRHLLYGDGKAVLMPTGTCLPFNKKMFITVNGKILVCERIDHDFAVGQVEHGKVTLDIPKIAELYQEFHNRISGQCRECYMQHSCSQCIFYTNIRNKKMKCGAYRNRNAFANYLASHVHYLEKNRWTYSYAMNQITTF